MALISFTGCTLSGMAFQPAWSATVPPYVVMGSPVVGAPFTVADYATIEAAILDDINPARVSPPNFATGLTRDGRLFVPNRGFLQIRPGDYVAYDAATGWPILISGRAAAGAGWTHT